MGVDRVNSTYSPGWFSVGVYNTTITAYDAANNSITCNFTFIVTQAQASTSSSSSIFAPIAGAAGAGFIVLLLLVIFVLYRRAQKKRLAEAAAGYAELLAASDEFILEKARIIQQTLMAQKQAVAPSMDAFAKKPERDFEAPPITLEGLIDYILDTVRKGLPRTSVVLGKELGHGEFGSVCEGIYRNSTTGSELKVAVKTLKTATAEDSKVRFLKEAAIMSQFNHPNIVRLIGVCLEPPSEPILILLEYMHLGSLQSYLESPTIKFQLEQLTLVRMALDIGAGMVYLSEAGFVHRDLAARNVLIDKEMTCRIGDFGLSVDLASVSEEDNGIYSGSEGARIPIRWSSPEAVLYRLFSTSSDVWSFGILIWEIWTYAEMPYGDWSNKKVVQQIQGGYRLPKPKNCHTDIYKLAIECWNKNPDRRPLFSRISARLIEVWKDINSENGGMENRDDSLDDVVDSGGLYDNSGNMAAGIAMEEEDDEMGYESTLQETNLNKTTTRRRKSAAPVQTYDIGNFDEFTTDNNDESSKLHLQNHNNDDDDDDDDDYEERNHVGRARGGGHSTLRPKKPQLYDYGGDGDLIRQPISVPFNEGARGRRESYGIDELHARDLGKRVVVSGYGMGTLVFIGPSVHDGEVYAGVELEGPNGISDGTFNGHRYFKCPDRHGILLPVSDVTLESEARVMARRSSNIHTVEETTSAPRNPRQSSANIMESDAEFSGGGGVGGGVRRTSVPHVNRRSSAINTEAVVEINRRLSSDGSSDNDSLPKTLRRASTTPPVVTSNLLDQDDAETEEQAVKKGYMELDDQE